MPSDAGLFAANLLLTAVGSEAATEVVSCLRMSKVSPLEMARHDSRLSGSWGNLTGAGGYPVNMSISFALRPVSLSSTSKKLPRRIFGSSPAVGWSLRIALQERAAGTDAKPS